MSGTVMAVTDVSSPALEGMQRRSPNQGRGIDLIDMNRQWPGNENGTTAASRHAGLLFNRLLRPNADVARAKDRLGIGELPLCHYERCGRYKLIHRLSPYLPGGLTLLAASKRAGAK
jgi:hypothetical protein